MPNGDKMNKREAWEVVIENFNKRLSGWKTRTMSFGGRLTLIKSVLSSLPLYFFSLFHAPSNIINLVEGMRRKFFWGGTGDENKLAWVNWDSILQPYGKGGLNIGSLKAKKTFLFWVNGGGDSKLKISHYGELTGRLHGEPSNLEARVRTIGSMNEEESKWIFKPSGKENYSSKLVASSIDALLLEGNSSDPETLRNNLMPQKLGIFVWKALKNRLPTKVELEKRGIILESLLCPLRNKVNETVEHALFSCDQAKLVWKGVLKWWEVNSGVNVGIGNAFCGKVLVGNQSI
ncbi:uncharacterized protein [Rutidosis leptorrhynchoides]|uniref:uncharacterized protein n=1 Tax=Rutidosis leptorrhynchoides TaxID=125765 RepID=UPI003A994D20